MELVGSSAGGSSFVSAGLGIWPNNKKKVCIENVYSYGSSYKKSRNPGVPGGVVNLLAGSVPGNVLQAGNLEHKVSWSSEIKSENASVSGVMQLIGLWQKALVKFESSDVASLVASKWSVLVGKDSVHIALAVNDKELWVALLYTLPVGMIAYDLSDLLKLYGEKTCLIRCNLSSYMCNRCVIVCFVNETSKLAAIGSTPVFKSQFGHISTGCLSSGNFGGRDKWVVTFQNWVHLANIYKKKQAPIIHPVSFSGKTWA
ncbi:hypothetical protein G9A89_016154 [Geosiphon pyriformis]|nr:hypothetical protein G9A89_016154 [Geosiphon pyriformis]